MKKLFISLAIIAAVLFAGPVLASPIATEHKACMSNADCGLVYLACDCGCGGERNIDAANKNFVDNYKDLAACSPEQTKHCAEAGACVHIKTPVPTCRNEQCVVRWDPIQR